MYGRMRTTLAVLLVALFIAMSWHMPAAAQETIRLGLLAPLSGFAASDGMSALNGVRMAVERVNEAGGVLGRQVELVYYDDQADPRLAASFATRLLQADRVDAIVGASYSGPTLAAAPIAQEAGVPFVAAYAVHPDITRTGSFIFRTGLGGLNEGAAAGVVLAENLNAKRIAVLTMNNDFGISLEEGLLDVTNELGLEVVFQSTYPVGTENFVPLITRIIAARPDAIFMSAYYGEASNFVRQLRQRGMQTPVVGSEGYDSPKFFELAGDYAEGVIVATRLDRESPRQVTQDYLQKFRTLYGYESDAVAASSYDATSAMLTAIENAGTTDPVAVRDAFAALTDFEGVTGRISHWTDSGNAVLPVQAQIVKNGAFGHFVEISDPAIILPPD